jgi:hypothetical protein
VAIANAVIRRLRAEEIEVGTPRVFSSPNTVGWVGIVAGSLGAIGALLSVGGATPWSSLAIFYKPALSRPPPSAPLRG